MHIHIHIHHHDKPADRKLDEIRTSLININKKIDLHMAKAQERYDALMARLDTVTNDIAADYQKLLTEIQENNVSAESLARGEANVAKLEAIGASVDNPVPGEPSEPTEPETPTEPTTDPGV